MVRIITKAERVVKAFRLELKCYNLTPVVMHSIELTFMGAARGRILGNMYMKLAILIYFNRRFLFFLFKRNKLRV